MSVPNYLPTKQDGSSYLGPVIGKQNYQELPPSNPLTDQDQTLLSPCMVDVANLGQTAPQVVIGFTAAASAGAMTLTYYSAQWINATATLPVMGRTGTGVFTFTMPATVGHEYTEAADNITNNIPVNIHRANGSMVDARGFMTLSASGNIITISLFSTSNVASDFVGNHFTIVGY